jgi:DeoR/GlpR family transcriptional regulator of sugar metabolism
MPESKALLRIDKGICYVSDLAEWLDVSEDTARRVLDETGVEPGVKGIGTCTT